MLKSFMKRRMSLFSACLFKSVVIIIVALERNEWVSEYTHSNHGGYLRVSYVNNQTLIPAQQYTYNIKMYVNIKYKIDCEHMCIKYFIKTAPRVSHLHWTVHHWQWKEHQRTVLFGKETILVPFLLLANHQH